MTRRRTERAVFYLAAMAAISLLKAYAEALVAKSSNFPSDSDGTSNSRTEQESSSFRRNLVEHSKTRDSRDNQGE